MNKIFLLIGLSSSQSGIVQNISGNGIVQSAILAFVMYILALVILRFGDKRFLGKNAAFDIILGIVIGSTISRAINGTASFLPTAAAILVLVGLHWLFAVLSLYSEKFSKIVKGRSRMIVKDGIILWEQMKKNHVTKDDLITQLHLQGKILNVENVKEAYLEKGGRISIIPRKVPKVVDIKIEEGIKTVRILIE
jgi:uncharacterized membrane protein YcaP (DUF421 family)